MSGWDAHIQAGLTANHPALAPGAALFGFDGTKWAGQPNWDAGDVKRLISGVDRPDELRAAGPKLGGTKFFVTTAVGGDFLVAKKGDQGLIVVKCKQSVVIVQFAEASMSPAQANVAVQAFGDYMKGLGY